MSSATPVIDLSPVQADTATLLARLTSGRATNLDNLNASVSSRATGTAVAALPQGVVKSVQRGSQATNAVGSNVTISSINPAKAFLHVGSTVNWCRGKIVNATTITLYSVTNGQNVEWEVVEFE